MSFFSALADNRRKAARQYGIFGFKKDGTRRDQPSATESTEAYAERKCQQMIADNPGKQYIVLPLN